MGAREIWAGGDYPSVATHLRSAGEAVVQAAGITAEDRVLDVACGNGNATLLAAATGATVTGLDITPELLEVGRAAAPEIDWVEGDAEALPFPEAHFDVVISTFGCMFAPDHERTGSELRRVVKPGGRIAIACWAPDGDGGAFFATIGRHAPPPPGAPPGLWGTEAHVRELLGDDVRCERRSVEFRFPSPEAAAAFYFESFGPIVAVRQIADEAALRADLDAFFRDHWKGDGFAFDYLLTVAGRS